MFAQQAALAWCCFRQNFRVKLKTQKRRKPLRDPPIGVVDLQQVTNLIGTIGAAPMPHIAPENNHVTRFTED